MAGLTKTLKDFGGQHRKHPLDWDMCGEWDGVVIRHRDGTWVRYTDRNGEDYETI